MKPTTPTMTLQPEPEEIGQRLDLFLAARLAPISRHQAQLEIKAGHVLVNGKARLPSHRLRAGETVQATPTAIAEPAPLKPLKRPLATLFEDEELIVINKPAGLVVHPAPGHVEDTLANMLLAHGGAGVVDIGGPNRCGIVHRLDKETSGVMLAAKTARAHEALTAALAARTIRRRYLAIALGHFDQPEGEIDRPIGRRPNERKLMGIVQTGRPAKTTYRVLLQEPGMALALIRLHTGRTHQIRVHFQSIGRPILGDPVYGWTKHRALAELGQQTRTLLGPLWPERQMLHAAGIRFQHPVTEEWITRVAGPPKDMAELMKTIFGEMTLDPLAEVREDLENVDAAETPEAADADIEVEAEAEAEGETEGEAEGVIDDDVEIEAED